MRCFHHSSMPIKSYCKKKLLKIFHQSWDDHRDERRYRWVTGAILWFSVSFSPVTRSFSVLRIAFVQKRRLSIFFYWHIMERAQNRPDLRSSISKFEIYILYILSFLSINLWKLQSDRSAGVPMTSIDFSWGEVTWRGLVTWPWATFLGNLYIIYRQNA